MPIPPRGEAHGGLAGGGDEMDATDRRMDRERYFPGDSEMAGRMRSFDWDHTDLGPPESWPENLQVAVRLCLCPASRSCSGGGLG